MWNTYTSRNFNPSSTISKGTVYRYTTLKVTTHHVPCYSTPSLLRFLVKSAELRALWCSTENERYNVPSFGVTIKNNTWKE